MKTIVSGLLVLGLIVGISTEANAVVCAKGVYRAGCAGPGGAVVTHGAAVVRPVPHCYWRAGVRVCR